MWTPSMKMREAKRMVYRTYGIFSYCSKDRIPAAPSLSEKWFGSYVVGGRTKPKSKQDRREPRTRWFVVKSNAHQGHRLDDLQSIREAPAQQCAVARRDENAGASKGFDRSDESLHVRIRLCRRVAEERERGCVSGNTASSLYHCGSVLLNGLCQLGPSVSRQAMNRDSRGAASVLAPLLQEIAVLRRG